MKVLVATKEGQGVRQSDFCWCDEGELVLFPFECDSDRGKIDGGCGCRRSMSGFASKKSTTTVKVAETYLTPELYAEAWVDSMVRSWGKLIPREEIERWADEEVADLLRVADTFPLGAVLEKRGDNIRERRVKP